MAEIGVIGSGSWGTALALVLNKNGHHVTMWTCVEKEMQMLSTCRSWKHRTGTPARWDRNQCRWRGSGCRRLRWWLQCCGHPSVPHRPAGRCRAWSPRGWGSCGWCGGWTAPRWRAHRPRRSRGRRRPCGWWHRWPSNRCCLCWAARCLS